MQVYTSPGELNVPATDNAVAALAERARTHPTTPALAHRAGDRFVNTSTADLWSRVRDIAAGLVAMGVGVGDRVAVFSSTRMEFTITQYAVWAAGAATVSIYETSSADQVEWIMSDSGSVMILCEDETLEGVFNSVADQLPACKEVFVFTSGGLDALAAAATAEARAEVERRIAAIRHEDLALLIYTSGTTGRPKGCVLSHRNFIWDVRQVVAELSELFVDGASTLMFLPLAHSFAQIVQVGCVSRGVTIGYSTGIPNLVEELAMFRPLWVFSVPRVFEKVFNSAKHNADTDGKGKIFDLATSVAIGYSKQLEAGKVKLGTRLAHSLFDKLVYGKLRDVFGGELEYAVSGGAALGSRLGHFYRGIGVTVLEGYGLTETTAATVVNRPGNIRVGTVGQPVPGVSIAIADDGEILLKGGCVFAGYWQNEDATRESFTDDGWFKTGDVGELDADGFLRITGRKKELIVTAGGKNVAPAVLEDRLRAHAMVSQCMVVGDGRAFVSALVTIDPDTFREWAAENGKTGDVADHRDDADLRALVQSAVDDANRAVSKAESIRTFAILPDDFTVEGGELTPTLKVKRRVVAERYGDAIEAIYTK